MAAGASGVLMIWRVMSEASFVTGPGRQCTRQAQHIGHAPDDANHLGEMPSVAHPHLEHEFGGLAVAFVQLNIVDVGVGTGDRGGHGSEHAHAVGDLEA